MSRWSLLDIKVLVHDHDTDTDYTLEMLDKACFGVDDEGEHYVRMHTIDIAEALERTREGVRGEK